MLSKMKCGLSCFGGGNADNDDRKGKKPMKYDSGNDGSDNDDADFTASTSERRCNEELNIWSRDLSPHFLGDYSFAVIRGNETIEDQSQVEVGNEATFVGVYDGHGGPVCSDYVKNRLFHHFIDRVVQSQTVSELVIKQAFKAMENDFMDYVTDNRDANPLLCAMGSCCLIGLIWRGTVYIANLGDSRVVLGYGDAPDSISAQQLSKEHNVKYENIRKEVVDLNADEVDIVVDVRGAWRVKGIIQISRSIGDFYLKDPKFAVPREYTRFHYKGEPVRIRHAVLRYDPTVRIQPSDPGDRFLIFASDGLWDHMDNAEAVRIVNKHPPEAIARRLIHKALRRAARNSNITFRQLRNTAAAQRRPVHDDITVVVVFLRSENVVEITEGLSVKGYSEQFEDSRINLLSNLPRGPDVAGTSSQPAAHMPGTSSHQPDPQAGASSQHTTSEITSIP